MWVDSDFYYAGWLGKCLSCLLSNNHRCTLFSSFISVSLCVIASLFLWITLCITMSQPHQFPEHKINSRYNHKVLTPPFTARSSAVSSSRFENPVHPYPSSDPSIHPLHLYQGPLCCSRSHWGYVPVDVANFIY